MQQTMMCKCSIPKKSACKGKPASVPFSGVLSNMFGGLLKKRSSNKSSIVETDFEKASIDNYCSLPLKKKEEKLATLCNKDVVLEDVVLCLAEHQHINGSWTIDDEILRKLGIDRSKVEENKPSSITDDVWMTIIIYQYLVVKLNDREKEWRLFAKKAKQWLCSSITDTASLDKLMEQGRAII